jgi:hypothetical protein
MSIEHAPPAPAQSRCHGRCSPSTPRSGIDDLHSIPGGKKRGPTVSVNGPLGSAREGIEPMTLITNAQRQKLLENGRAQRAALDQ